MPESVTIACDVDGVSVSVTFPADAEILIRFEPCDGDAEGGGAPRAREPRAAARPRASRRPTARVTTPSSPQPPARALSRQAEREAGLVFHRGRLLPGEFRYEPWLGPAGAGWLVRRAGVRGHGWRVDQENEVRDAVAVSMDGRAP